MNDVSEKQAGRMNGGTAGFALVPKPVSMEVGPGRILLPLRTRISSSGVDPDLGGLLSRQISDDLAAATGLVPDVSRGDLWPSVIELGLDPELGDQEYRLDIEASPESVRIVGGDGEGLRYGVQTLRQIIRQTAPLLPVLHIEDHPAYSVRSYYLDVTRGRVPTLDWLKRWADKLALYKFNQLQLYIEHSFAFDGMSEAWRGKSPLKPEDILEYDRYCADLGIELVPSISTFSHHYTNLRTRTLRSLGEFPEDADRPYSFIERQEHHTLNVTDPDSFKFSTRLIDSYAQLFRSNKFNIGADETFDLGKGRSKARAEQVGVAAMYADYVVRLCDHVRDKGGEPMFWGDIAVSMPEVLERLPKDCPLLNWLYDPQVGEEKVALVSSTGAKQYVCSAVHAWNSLLPSMDGAWQNIHRLSTFGIKYGAVGAMVTDWGDYGHINDPRMSVPGLVYAAQNFWDPDGMDREEADDALSKLEYGDASGRYARSFARASHAISFGWDDMVRYVELDDGRGGVNKDVSGCLAGGFPEIWQGKDPVDLKETRHDYMAWCGQRAFKAPDYNRDLEGIAADLALSLSQGRGDAEGALQAQEVALRGQEIFNEVGWVLASREGLSGGSGAEPPQAWSVAAELEEWFETYRSVWRRVSRESELRRVSHVIWSFADFLRS